MFSLKAMMRFSGLFAALVSCGESPSESVLVGAGGRVQVQATSSEVSDAGTVAGYVHSVANTRFLIGDDPQPANDSRATRVRGATGTFATFNGNGAVFANLNGRAPATVRSPWSGNAASHSAQVVSYFESAGLPSDQVGNVLISSGQIGGGPGNSAPPTPMFVGFSSSIVRTVQGVVVSESVAHARFNGNGDVVSEGVYWPPLPQSVFDDAAIIRTTLADPVAGPAYLSNVPSGGTNGRVVVHHTAATVPNAPFVAVACYEALYDRTWLKFDKNGNAVQLPQELATGTPSSR